MARCRRADPLVIVPTSKALTWWMLGITLAASCLGLALGPAGWAWLGTGSGADPVPPGIVWDLRGPRVLGAWTAGALLGLGGALAQGVFRNPLADPFLLGSASGAAAGAASALVVASWVVPVSGIAALGFLTTIGVSMAAFVGALLAVLLALLMARGPSRPMTLLVAGIAVGVLLGAVREAITILAPDTLRPMQAFMLGSTAFVTWQGAGLMAVTLSLSLALSLSQARNLDAMLMGDDTARSLGVAVVRVRALAIGVMALTTALAVAQTGLIAFVGLAAPHIARRAGHARHAPMLVHAALAGGALLLVADVSARLLWLPTEWPVGGLYLLVALRRMDRPTRERDPGNPSSSRRDHAGGPP
jgi:iron complex transport system permease protein